MYNPGVDGRSMMNLASAETRLGSVTLPPASYFLHYLLVMFLAVAVAVTMAVLVAL